MTLWRIPELTESFEVVLEQAWDVQPSPAFVLRLIKSRVFRHLEMKVSIQ